jgi:hypothetical protein
MAAGPPGIHAGNIVGGAPFVGPMTSGPAFVSNVPIPTINFDYPPTGGPPIPPGPHPGPGPGPGPPIPPPPGCINVVSHWVVRICLTPLGVAIYFKNVHDGVFSIVGCLYPGTGKADFDWILAQKSKGKAVWERFYYLPYYLIF